MARVLITGMSATGKSSVIESLRTMGFVAIDTDVDGWRVPPDGAQPAGRRVEPEWVWDEARMSELLASRDSPLFVSGCVENQGQFYDRFDEIVLLTGPVGTIGVERSLLVAVFAITQGLFDLASEYAAARCGFANRATHRQN